MSEMRLYDPLGNRLYLNQEERSSFLNVARIKSPKIRTFAEILYYTGCRISEALEITPNRIEFSDKKIIIRSLKKRRHDIYRAIPAPETFLDTLNTAHNIREIQNIRKKANSKLWNWHRQHAWRVIKSLMIEANIPDGPHRSPKGLRHGFGVNAIVSGVPLNMVQKWMGHADISTTAIYANAIGREEQEIAARMWNRNP